MATMYTRYFVFSSKQVEEMNKIADQRGASRPKLGTVVVNVIPKEFTAILTNIDHMKYADSKVLISGDIRTIKHNMGDLNLL